MQSERQQAQKQDVWMDPNTSDGWILPILGGSMLLLFAFPEVCGALFTIMFWIGMAGALIFSVCMFAFIPEGILDFFEWIRASWNRSRFKSY